MKRDLVFTGTGQLPQALGIDPERVAELEAEMNSLIARNAKLRTIIEHFNDRGDLTDSEWTAMVFALGYYDARNNR